jgi:hypothetical protein
VSTFQVTAVEGIADAQQMAGRLVGRLQRGVEGGQVREQAVRQQMACPVGKGADPCADGGVGWAGRQPVHDAAPTQSHQEVQVHGLLQEAEHVVPVRVQEVREQAVRATAGLAAHALDGDGDVSVPQAGPAGVEAPADQAAGGPAGWMETALGERKDTLLGLHSKGVIFDGTGEVLYNDHTLRTPLCVGELASNAPRREVSSFLSRFPAIIPVAADSVKLEGPRGIPIPQFLLITQSGHERAGRSRPIDPDHPAWPGKARFRSSNPAAYS